MKTIWSPLEIAGSYRRSGQKQSQIQIIAECNACDKETIKQILREQGFEIKEKEKKKMPRTKKEAAVQDESQEATTVPETDEIIVNTLEEKQYEILCNLTSIAEKQEELRKEEEELTRQYEVIKEFLKNIS